MPYSDIQISQPSICDDIFQAGTDYVYFQYSQFPSPSELRRVLEAISPVVTFLKDEICKKAAKTLICIHFLIPCGHNNLVHVPRFICPESCDYVSTGPCSSEWARAETLIPTTYGEQYALPNCSHPGEHLKSLNLSGDCCVNGNITRPG